MSFPVSKISFKHVTIIVFILVIFWFFYTETNIGNVPDQAILQIFEVSVIKAVPKDRKVIIKEIGVSHSRWRTIITAGISGRVIELQEKTIPGNRLSKNYIMMKINDSLYRSEQQLTLAKVAQSELALAKIKNEQEVIKKISNSRSKTEYAQLVPHIKSAKTDLLASQTSYQHATVQLQETLIKAPFNAIILERKVTPGQWVNIGDQLFSLAHSDLMDIHIGLSELSWNRIGDINENTIAKIITPSGREWSATLYYFNPELDPVTRQRNIVLQVKNPYDTGFPLLSGQQVNVVFTGPLQTNIIKAPASVLTEDGKVWSIINDLLVLENIELLEEQSEYILYRYKHKPSQKRLLVRYPLSSMLVGQKVKAVLVEVSL